MQGGFFSEKNFFLLEIALVICFSSFYFMEDRNRFKKVILIKCAISNCFTKWI